MSNNKIIVTDMDDVLVNLLKEWVSRLNKTWGTNVKEEDIVDWDMTKAFPMVPEELLCKDLFEEDFWKNVKPCEGAVKYTNLLHEEGYKILVATASHFDSIAMKLKYALFPYFKFLTYKDIIITHNKKILDCDYIIDDYQENLRGSKAIKILKTKPYNKNYTDICHDYRVDNWEQIYNIIHNSK